jgi:hypothetical protein
LTVTFRRGKVTKAIGPYSIHTAIGVNFDHLKVLLHDQNDRWLWEAPSVTQRRKLISELNLTLKRADSDLSSYSIRRGSIQHLAQAGLEERIVRALSGHTNQKQLMVYLDHGVKYQKGTDRGLNIGEILNRNQDHQPTGAVVPPSSLRSTGVRQHLHFPTLTEPQIGAGTLSTPKTYLR